jgi:hypothetical protein
MGVASLWRGREQARKDRPAHNAVRLFIFLLVHH